MLENREPEVIEAELRSLNLDTVTAEELPAMTERMEALNTELLEARAAKAEQLEKRANTIDAELTYTEKRGNIMENLEKRTAFMNWVLKGEQYRQDAVGTAANAPIPTELYNQIVEKLQVEAVLYPRVQHTMVKWGFGIAVDNSTITATWVAEGAGSDTVAPATTTVAFNAHKLRCEMAYTLEAGVESLPAFEAYFVDRVAKAMINAIEAGIINGTGVNQMTGIETSVTTTTATTYDYAGMLAMEADIPEAYYNHDVYVMKPATWFKILAIKDTAGQPIARVNAGIAGKAPQMLFGREVLLSSNVTADQVIAFNPADYYVNTNYNVGIERRSNWDNENFEAKAVMLLDGKLVKTDAVKRFALS